jgi:hypothetical protein
MAQSNNMSGQAFLKELEKRNGVASVQMQLLHEKVIDFLLENANIESVAPAAPAPQTS